MSTEVSNLERRVTTLELALKDILSRLADDEAKLAAAYTQSLYNSGGGGGGPSSNFSVFWAEATVGISKATVTGSVGARTLTPGSATCDLYSFDQGSNTWTYYGQDTVYNDYPSSTTGVASGHWVQVYQDQYGKTRVLGEQC